MKRLAIRKYRSPGPALALLSLAVIVSGSESSHAALVLTTSSGMVNYSLYHTGGGSDVQFDSSNRLVAPGAGFPSLIPQPPGTQGQTNSGVLSPPLVVPSVTGSSGNTVPPPFGTANTIIYATGSGSQGNVTTQGGIFWDTRTSLVDGLTNPDQALAAVSYSTASATFTNLNATAASIRPGALLSIRGTVGGGLGSYVAAGLASSYQLSGGPLVTNTNIVLAANQGGSNIAQTGGVSGDGASISYGNSQLFASASSYFGTQSILVAQGQSITINATLTLISDPMSSLSITSDLVPGFLGTVPDFGAFAGGTVFNSAVPEPSTIAMLGLGLASVGAWRVRARGRRTTRD